MGGGGGGLEWCGVEGMWGEWCVCVWREYSCDYCSTRALNRMHTKEINVVMCEILVLVYMKQW